MAGIYIHIPFCRRKCYYCDFYKTTNNSRTSDFLEALRLEINSRKDYLKGEPVETIYFGGGTPSVLNEKQISDILFNINKHYSVKDSAEITLEANPDDLTNDYLQELRNTGINRLSIGVQSFNDELLKRMNRRHDSKQAKESLTKAYELGFTNISADLIYGLPGLDSSQWRHDLKEMFLLPIVHLSAYHLTYHQGTPFYTWLKKGTLKELSETDSITQFNTLLDESVVAGFEHYELSNFARNNMYSQHNKAYWFGKSYLGLGPSAHSFDGNSRRWNVAHLEAYINGINKNSPFFEEEHLTGDNKFNEFILTRIRTKWGISLKEIEDMFGVDAAKDVKLKADKLVNEYKMVFENDRYSFTRDGLFISDSLMTEFIRV